MKNNYLYLFLNLTNLKTEPMTGFDIFSLCLDFRKRIFFNSNIVYL
jgi:hypothetical protein